MSARSTHKPWPMKYVAITILVCIGGYTFLTLHFRKQSPAYQPYEDNKSRATVQRLRSAGYQRIAAVVDRPAEPQVGLIDLNGVSTTPMGIAGGLPADLKETLIDQPHLAVSFSRVRAASEANPLFPYAVEFTCTLADNHRLHTGTFVYLRDQEIEIVSDFETIEGELRSRTADTTVRLTLPAGLLATGEYQVTLVGERESKRWTLQVH